VLQGQEDFLSFSGKVGVGVTESVQVGAPSKRLTRLGVGALAGVVDEDERQLEGSLKMAEVSQEPRDILGAVFIQRVQPDQRIEEEKPRPEVGDGGAQAQLVPLGVEVHGGLGDDRDLESVDGDPPVAADGFEAAADLRKSVLGEVDEGGAGSVDAEAVEGRSAGGDADREVQAKPTLQRLRCTSDHPHCFSSPEAVDEPAVLGLLALEVASEDGREEFGLGRIHGHSTFRAPTTWLWSTVSAF
jgi:hypothetical protein